jgi:hypothetical protein
MYVYLPFDIVLVICSFLKVEPCDDDDFLVLACDGIW